MTARYYVFQVFKNPNCQFSSILPKQVDRELKDMRDS